MKKIAFVLLLVLVVGLATAAFATDRNIKFNNPIVVNGTKVPAGEYTLRYVVKDNTAEVQIMDGKKVVASAKAPVTDSKDKLAYDSIIRATNPDGSETMKAIQIAKDNKVITIEGGDTAVGK